MFGGKYQRKKQEELMFIKEVLRCMHGSSVLPIREMVSVFSSSNVLTTQNENCIWMKITHLWNMRIKVLAVISLIARIYRECFVMCRTEKSELSPVTS